MLYNIQYPNDHFTIINKILNYNLKDVTNYINNNFKCISNILGLTLLYQIIGIKLQKEHLKNEIDENIKFVLKPSKIWLSDEIKSYIIKLVNQKQSSNDIYDVDENNKIVIKRMYNIYIICEIVIFLSITCLFIIDKNNAFQIIIKSFVLSLIVILTEFWFYRYIIYNTPVLDINTIYINLINKI